MTFEILSIKMELRVLLETCYNWLYCSSSLENELVAHLVNEATKPGRLTDDKPNPSYLIRKDEVTQCRLLKHNVYKR